MSRYIVRQSDGTTVDLWNELAEFLQTGGGGVVTQKMENNATGAPIYIGHAAPGTAASDAGWRIKKLTYDGNGAVTDIQWADGSTKFEKTWDDRATYSYS